MAFRGDSISEKRGVPRCCGECQPFGEQKKRFEASDRKVNASGNVIRSEILGAVKMKCYLSGMPELRLGLNDKVMFETTGRGESACLVSR